MRHRLGELSAESRRFALWPNDLAGLVAACWLVIFATACSADVSPGTLIEQKDAPAELVTATTGLSGTTLDGAAYVQDGPFTFFLTLYSDAGLQPIGSPKSHPRGASFISDVPEVGWRALWLYTGPAIEGTHGEYYMREFWGTLGSGPGIAPVSAYRTLSAGMSGGRAGGGVLLPKSAQAGDEIEIEIKLTTQDGSYGAVLSFELAAGLVLKPGAVHVNPL